MLIPDLPPYLRQSEMNKAWSFVCSVLARWDEESITWKEVNQAVEMSSRLEGALELMEGEATEPGSFGYIAESRLYVPGHVGLHSCRKLLDALETAFWLRYARDDWRVSQLGLPE
jgi:hypothetical protein